VSILHVEYAEPGNGYGILFILSLFFEYTHLEYIRIYAIYRVNQAEYGIHILVVAPQEYANIGLTHKARGKESVYTTCVCIIHVYINNLYLYIYMCIYMYIYINNPLRTVSAMSETSKGSVCADLGEG